MKQSFLVYFFVASVVITACNDDKNTGEDLEFTGREAAYDLIHGSDFPTEGTVIFKEKSDFSLQVEVKLSGTEGDAFHPVHLHYGNLSTPDAAMAAQLNDLSAATGESITILSHLMDESEFGYTDLINFDGSIKVHLSASGEGKSIVLAGGNVGIAADGDSSNGRQTIAVCQSE